MTWQLFLDRIDQGYVRAPLANKAHCFFVHIDPSDKTTGFLPLIKAVIRASRSIGQSGLSAAIGAIAASFSQGQIASTRTAQSSRSSNLTTLWFSIH